MYAIYLFIYIAFKVQENGSDPNPELKNDKPDKCDQLEQIIGHSDFYLEINSANSLKDSIWIGKIGKFTLSLFGISKRFSPLNTVPDVDVFYLYVREGNSEMLLYYDVFDNTNDDKKRTVMFYGAICDLPIEVWQSLKSKHVKLTRANYDQEQCRMEINACIQPSKNISYKKIYILFSCIILMLVFTISIMSGVKIYGN